MNTSIANLKQQYGESNIEVKEGHVWLWTCDEYIHMGMLVTDFPMQCI